MRSNLNEYSLSEFLNRVYDCVTIEDRKIYKRITVKTKGEGISLRDEIEGLQIGTKSQYSVRKNQFLLSKIDAMNGAFGIIPEECDGGIITGNFWVYDFDEKIICKEFLELLCRKQVFKEFSFKASTGTTNRKYLDESKFLNLRIALPIVTEQQVVATEIQHIHSKLKRVATLIKEQLKEIRQLIFSRFIQITEECQRLPFSKVAPSNRRPVEIEPETIYHEIGARSFGKGIFEKPSFAGKDLTWQQPYWIHSGDLVFSNIKAWEGAIAVASGSAHLKVASHRYLTYTPIENVTSAEFLCYYFLTPEGLEILGKASPGSADRNRTLNTRFLNNVMIPIPLPEVQLEFLEFKCKMETVQKHHASTLKELDELFPSLLDKAFKGEL